MWNRTCSYWLLPVVDVSALQIYSCDSNPSDNRSCRKGFRPCYNQRCVANSRFCDKIDDCGDNSDEAFCASESHPFDLLFNLPYLRGQNPTTLMLRLINRRRPHAVLSPHRLMSPRSSNPNQTNSKKLSTFAQQSLRVYFSVEPENYRFCSNLDGEKNKWEACVCSLKLVIVIAF